MNTALNESVRAAAIGVKVGREVTGEQLRQRAEKAGTTTKTPSDWGRATSQLIKSGILTATGKMVAATSKQARGRKVAVYTRNSARTPVAA
jgi:hypothetical protein